MRVITFRLVTTSFTTSCSRPEYKSSVFSRKITMSIFTSSKRVFRPGSECTGRTLAIQIEMLAQRDVDALESAADRRGDGAFQADLRAFERFDHVRRQHLAAISR